jgi:hypothetical protein
MRGSRLEIELTSYQEELRKRGVGREYNRNTIGERSEVPVLLVK